MGAVELHQQQPLPVVDAAPVLSLNSLPLGFRFRPTDEELIDYYLRQKINGNGDEVWVIREIDVCKWEPWDLPGFSVVRNKDPEWFFFCPHDRKYPNGHRLNRATTNGYWKATGKDRKIKSGSTLIGMKKTLVFYTGRAPKGKRTNWVMHEYRPTLKELDGTNPGQSPYVICRLFKKQDESLEGSNCDEVEQTASTPTTANYSPEEIQSDHTLNPVSSSLATEDDKQLAVIPENSEEAISNIITTVDSPSDGCDAHDAQNQNVAVEPSRKEDQQLNFDIFYDQTSDQFDDTLFSPINMHIPEEFYHQSNNESDGRCGPQHQYGTNEINISDFFDSVVNWDDISYEDSSGQTLNSTWSDVKGNGLWGDLNEMTNLTSRQVDDAYPGEAIDTEIPLLTTKEFNATTFNLDGNELNSNIGLFQNNSQMAFSTGVGMDQVYNVSNDNMQSRNFNMDASGEALIRMRTRHEQNEEPSMNMQPQGTAQRRVRLARFVMDPNDSDDAAKDVNCESEEHNSKPTTAGESKPSEDPAAGESASDANVVEELEEKSTEVGLRPRIRSLKRQGIVQRGRLEQFVMDPHDSGEAAKDASCESEDHNSKPTIARESKPSEDHAGGERATVTNVVEELGEKSTEVALRPRIRRRKQVSKAESFSGLKHTLFSRRACYTSKASSNLFKWSSVFAVSATVLVLLMFFVNTWGYIKV